MGPHYPLYLVPHVCRTFQGRKAERGTSIHLNGDSLVDYGQELESEVGQEGVMWDAKNIFSTRWNNLPSSSFQEDCLIWSILDAIETKSPFIGTD